jgi:UMF1 family MFS transporter
MTGSLYFVASGDWRAAVLLFGMASIGFSGAGVFYDSLLVDVAPPEHADLVSSYGFAVGYLGGGMLFALNVWMTLAPATFGLADVAAAVKISFVTVALWWLVFSLPIMLFVREQRVAPKLGILAATQAGMARLAHTYGEIRSYPEVFTFLLAYWLYIDGVNTVQKMAVDYGMALGFPTQSLIMALLLVQFIGFPAALGFGFLARRVGTLACLFIGIGVYMLLTCYAVFLSNVGEFYALAVVVGLVQGGLQSLSRSYLSKLTPPDRAGEFFGFYNMLGKFAAVLGPFLTAGVTLLTGSPRWGIFSLILLFLGGAGVLARARRYPRAALQASM